MEKEFDLVVNRLKTHSVKWDTYPPDVLPMWIADLDFKAPPSVLKILEEKINHGIFGYESDFLILKQVFAAWVKEHYSWDIREEEIMFIPGVVTGLNLIVQSLGHPGESLIIQPPVYPPFFKVASYAQMQTIESNLVESAEGFYTLDFQELESAVTPQTKFLILCSPHNPVGRVFSREELKTLADICVRKNLLIISDEIHCDLLFDGRKHIPIASINEDIAQQTITLMAPSKTFNLAGLKCSFMIIKNPSLRSQIEEGRRGLVGCPSLLSMEAAYAAYADGSGWLQQLIAYLQENRDFLVSFLHEEIPSIRVFPPEGTYLAWLDCRKLGEKCNPYEFFLEKAKIAFNDGGAFGNQGKGFVRMNFGCPRSTLEQALERISKAVLEMS